MACFSVLSAGVVGFDIADHNDLLSSKQEGPERQAKRRLCVLLLLSPLAHV